MKGHHSLSPGEPKNLRHESAHKCQLPVKNIFTHLQPSYLPSQTLFYRHCTKPGSRLPLPTPTKESRCFSCLNALTAAGNAEACCRAPGRGRAEVITRLRTKQTSQNRNSTLVDSRSAFSADSPLNCSQNHRSAVRGIQGRRFCSTKRKEKKEKPCRREDRVHSSAPNKTRRSTSLAGMSSLNRQQPRNSQNNRCRFQRAHWPSGSCAPVRCPESLSTGHGGSSPSGTPRARTWQAAGWRLPELERALLHTVDTVVPLPWLYLNNEFSY